MITIFLVWLARATLAVLLVASLLPLLPVGAWYVRLCDFPRLQLAVLTFVPLAACWIAASQRGWNQETTWLTVVACSLFIWQMSHVIPYTSIAPEEVAAQQNADRSSLRVLVANLQFDNTEREAVRHALDEQDADVLLLIEIDEAWHEDLAPLRQRYPNTCGVLRDEGLGIQLWSKIEMASSEVRHLVSELRASLFVELRLQSGQVVNIVGVHPTPPGLDDDTGEWRRDSRERDAELVLVAEEVRADSDKHWIVTGDFNDVAWSETTGLFKRLSGLRDPRIGRQLLNTYHAQYPLLRYPIDHVFVSPGFELVEFRRFVIPGSDHFGVVAEFVPPVYEPPPEPVDDEDEEEAEELVEEGKEDAADRGVLAN